MPHNQHENRWMMTDIAPRYLIEPYIGNGKTQWALYKTHADRYVITQDGHCGSLGHDTESLICIVNSLYKARELLAHMKHMKETSEGDDDYESDLTKRIKDALWFAKSYGGLDSSHHKAWV